MKGILALYIFDTLSIISVAFFVCLIIATLISFKRARRGEPPYKYYTLFFALLAIGTLTRILAGPLARWSFLDVLVLIVSIVLLLIAIIPLVKGLRLERAAKKKMP